MIHVSNLHLFEERTWPFCSLCMPYHFRSFLVNVPGPVPGWSAANNPVSQATCNIGTSIGACNANLQCPGQSVCQVPPVQSAQCQQAPQQCSTCCYTGGVGA